MFSQLAGTNDIVCDMLKVAASRRSTFLATKQNRLVLDVTMLAGACSTPNKMLDCELSN